MKKYKIITNGFTTEVNIDEESIQALIRLFENLNNKVEIYEVNDREYKLVEKLEIKKD